MKSVNWNKAAKTTFFLLSQLCDIKWMDKVHDCLHSNTFLPICLHHNLNGLPLGVKYCTKGKSETDTTILVISKVPHVGFFFNSIDWCLWPLQHISCHDWWIFKVLFNSLTVKSISWETCLLFNIVPIVVLSKCYFSLGSVAVWDVYASHNFDYLWLFTAI